MGELVDFEFEVFDVPEATEEIPKQILFLLTNDDFVPENFFVFLVGRLDFLFLRDYIVFRFRTTKTILFVFTLTRQMKGLPV